MHVLYRCATTAAYNYRTHQQTNREEDQKRLPREGPHPKPLLQSSFSFIFLFGMPKENWHKGTTEGFEPRPPALEWNIEQDNEAKLDEQADGKVNVGRHHQCHWDKDGFGNEKRW